MLWLLPLLAGLAGGAASSMFGGGSSKQGDGKGGDGSQGQYKQFPRYTPEQQQLINKAIKQIQPLIKEFTAKQPPVPPVPGGGQFQPHLNQLFSQLGQPSENTFAPIAQQARNQYYGQTLPGLAERFTGMGGTGRSAGFGNLMNQQSGQFEQGLASLQQQYGQQENAQALQRQSVLANLLGNQQQYGLQRYQLGQGFKQQQFGQRQNQLSSLFGLATTPTTENAYLPGQPRQPGFAESALPGLAQGLGQGAINYGLRSLWG